MITDIIRKKGNKIEETMCKFLIRTIFYLFFIFILIIYIFEKEQYKLRQLQNI